MNRLIWNIKRFRQHLGWQGMAGIGLGLLSIGLSYFMIQPALLEIGNLRQELTFLQKAPRSSARPLHIETERPEAQLAAFYHFFPARESAPVWLEKIHQSASAHQLVLDQGDYRVSQDKDRKITRYQITLPVSGSYVQIRNFLAAVLADIPAASLDAVRFQRQKAADSQVTAEIKLTVFLGGG